ncbi:MAG: ribbon-helix-helix protein, CopG family [Rhabdochlamydiaceae bacterium]
MADKKTMTLNLTEQEMAVLEELAIKKDLSKTAVLRQALKLYQLVDVRLSQGERMFFENGGKEEKMELAVL